MNKYVIALTIMLLPAFSMVATNFYRDNNGRWYSINKKTGERKEIFTTNGLKKSPYQESRRIPQNNPYDTSFYSDSTYPKQDGTNRNMGNR